MAIAKQDLGESLPAEVDRGLHERWIERGGALRKQMWRKASLERRIEGPKTFRDCADFSLSRNLPWIMRMISR